MPEKVLIENCSPTLAGIKTASLVNLKWEDSAQAMREMREMNRAFGSKGLRAVPLRFRKGRTLLYLYRPDQLQKDLMDERAQACLKKLGYPCGNPEQCVVFLAERVRQSPDFPHEIGFFLGYPETDVICFMEGRKDYVCADVWKAYSNEEEAKKTFTLYRRCTELYTKRLESGEPIDRLIVKTAEN